MYVQVCVCVYVYVYVYVFVYVYVYEHVKANVYICEIDACYRKLDVLLKLDVLTRQAGSQAGSEKKKTPE